MALARPALRRFQGHHRLGRVRRRAADRRRGVGIVAHGRSGPKAIRNAVRVAAEAAAVGMASELIGGGAPGAELCGKKPGRGNGKKAGGRSVAQHSFDADEQPTERVRRRPNDAA